MNKPDTTSLKLIIALIAGLLLLVFIYGLPRQKTAFNAQNAFSILAKLQSFGPRVPGSTAHKLSREFIVNQLLSNGWLVEDQTGQVQGHTYFNIFAHKSSQPVTILLGSHYDSRMKADRDINPLFRGLPVPGANDGGSSTAVLLELSRILPQDFSSNIGFVFFDLEDQGNIEGWDWILGSRKFVEEIKFRPEAMILLDMVGGYDQNIQPPVNSDRVLYQEIQSTANKLGYGSAFSNSAEHPILDDHVPFLEAGIHSLDLIDIIDAQWHTTDDGLENINLSSLQIIGDTLTRWILVRNSENGY